MNRFFWARRTRFTTCRRRTGQPRRAEKHEGEEGCEGAAQEGGGGEDAGAEGEGGEAFYVRTMQIFFLYLIFNYCEYFTRHTQALWLCIVLAEILISFHYWHWGRNQLFVRQTYLRMYVPKSEVMGRSGQSLLVSSRRILVFIFVSFHPRQILSFKVLRTLVS